MDDPGFDFDSSFVVPSAKSQMLLFSQLRDGHPGCPLTIFGHADPTGDVEYNKTLSGRRAASVYALFTRRIDIWEQLFSSPFGGDQWGARSIEATLRTNVSQTTGRAFLEGQASGGAATTSATRAFQTEHGLAADGIAGPLTRAKLFEVYMQFLTTDDATGEAFVLDAAQDFLGRGADPDGKADFQGCGEHNPVLVFSLDETNELARTENKARRDAENSANRRVLAFFFEKGSRASVGAWPCPRAGEDTSGCKARFFSDADARVAPQPQRRAWEGDAGASPPIAPHATMGCRFYHLFALRSPCEVSRKLAVVRIHIQNARRDPMPAAHYILTVGDLRFEGVTDADGLLVQQVPAESTSGHLSVVDAWEADLVFRNHDPVDTSPGATSRLANLAFVDAGRLEDGPGANEDLDRLIAGFQDSFDDLERSGQLDGPTQAKLLTTHRS
ncbi:MAG: peptidoglycan-binding protein [Polyangiaceae bacterium]